MWDLPVPGIEPVSPALAGGFLTTAPPGKPRNQVVLTPKYACVPYAFLTEFEEATNLLAQTPNEATTRSEEHV